MKHLHKLYQTILSLSLLALTAPGCKKLVEAPAPITSISSANVYLTDAAAAAVLTGIYTNISSGGMVSGVSSTSFYLSMAGDEMGFFPTSQNGSFLPFYQNTLNNSTPNNIWNSIYPMVFTTNAAIEGLTGNEALTPAVDKQLLGEAKFMRAFCYFYLVNMYGDVPLATTTNYKVNGTMGRTSTALVYDQIIADLKDAQDLLSDYYVDGTIAKSTTNRVRPTKWAAAALLARTYLYKGDWQNAEAAASMVINDSTTYKLSPPAGAFLANSFEAIWQLQPVAAGQNTPDAIQFILPSSGPNNTNFLYLSQQNLIDSFESGDLRLSSWVSSVTVPVGAIPTTYYYPSKYKAIGSSVTEYTMALRLGEQYLIRAEARAQLNLLPGAAADLNAIRARAGLPGIGASTQPDLLIAIFHERQVELFTEWGHRWFDLKRTKQIDKVMTAVAPQKASAWDTRQQLYPLPLADIQRNPHLTQNPGY